MTGDAEDGVGSDEERLWTFDAVEVGQRGVPVSVVITAADIAEYARVSQNSDPFYQVVGAPAMPTMLLSYAPLFRDQVAANNGFTALEVSRTARRQTPFTKCECRWQAQVHAGDEITSERWVQEKYERRGSRFVVFRVTARNQHGLLVGEYDYTCIFDYAKGQRSDANLPRPDQLPAWDRIGPARLGQVVPGAALVPFEVMETQGSMDAKDAFRLFGERVVGSNIHTDEEFAKRNIFGTTVNSGPATMAYVDRMLERNFAPGTLVAGGRLLMRAITPFRSGDRVSLGGQIDVVNGTDVRCSIKGINQVGALVCIAEVELKGVTGPRD
jgi:acyl dehydratase